LSGGISGATLASDAGTSGAAKKGGEPGDSNRGPGNGNRRGPGQETGRPGNPGPGRPDGRGVEVNGRITAIDAAAGTFEVGTAKVSVPAGVIIRHGNRTFLLADLAVGDRVQVKGSRDEAGVVVASDVKVEPGRDNADDDQDGDDDGGEPQVTGAVSTLTGTCPALSFNIQTTAVTTSATTTFTGVTCAEVANGTIVEVEGTLQADGSIAAAHVALED
jgi:hypothetical protein